MKNHYKHLKEYIRKSTKIGKSLKTHRNCRNAQNIHPNRKGSLSERPVAFFCSFLMNCWHHFFRTFCHEYSPPKTYILQYVITSLRHYASTSMRQYVITSILQYVSTSLRSAAQRRPPLEPLRATKPTVWLRATKGEGCEGG